MNARKRSYYIFWAILALGCLIGCPGDDAPPEIDLGLISISHPDLSGKVTVTGLPDAVKDETPPINYTVTNIDSSDHVSGVINPDGSFVAILPGSVGDSMFLYAIDGLGYWVEVGIGTVPPIADTTPPIIEIESPKEGQVFSWTQEVPFIYSITDPESGVAHSAAHADSRATTTGQIVPARDLKFGNHIFAVRAVNEAGLRAFVYVTFSVEANEEDFTGELDRFVDAELISPAGFAQSLKAKAHAAAKARNRGDLDRVLHILAAMQKQNEAQFNKHISSGECPCPEEYQIHPGAFIYDWLMYRMSVTRIELGIAPEYPKPLPFLISIGSIEGWVPELGQTVSFKQTVGKYSLLFERDVDPDVLSFQIVDSEIEFEPVELDGKRIEFCRVTPFGVSEGTVDLRSGLVQEDVSYSAFVKIDGLEMGPLHLQTSLIGVVRYPDLASAALYMSTSGYLSVPAGVPILSGCNFFALQSKWQPWVEEVTWKYEWNAEKGHFELTGTLKMTDCANEHHNVPDLEMCPAGGARSTKYPDRNNSAEGIKWTKVGEHNWTDCELVNKWTIKPDDPAKPVQIQLTGWGNTEGPERDYNCPILLEQDPEEPE